LVGAGLAEQGEDLAGDVALETAHDFAVGSALGGATSGVVAGGLVPAQPHQRDPVQRGVGLPVAAAIQPMPGGLASGGLDWAGAT
jgi:hypothetical protein